MKKKILICLCTFALAVGLVGCSSDEDKTYAGRTEAEYMEEVQAQMDALRGIDLGNYSSELEAVDQDDEIALGLMEEWKNLLEEEEMGEFVQYSDFTVDKAGKTITATLTSDYSGRDVNIIFVYNANKIEDGPTAEDVEFVYSVGEKMQKAALNTVMGILIVFFMLVIMSIIISFFKVIPMLEEKAKNKGAKAEEKAEVQASENTSDVSDDLALIAVISAAIAASTGAATDSFVVRSIKRR